MESHHDGDETKGSVHLFMQDYIEARKASRSVRPLFKFKPPRSLKGLMRSVHEQIQAEAAA
jgi:hypothetical protein